MEKKRKNKGFREQFFDAFRYLKESTNYILAVVFIFVSGGIFGAVYSSKLGFIDEFLKEIVSKIKSMDNMGIILFILQNNLKSSLFGMLFGIIVGIFPVINCISNGVVLGYVMKGVWLESGFREFWRILPHGVFELPAVFISLALGLKLGMFIFAKEKWKTLIWRARNSMIIFVCIVIPLLIIAAIIEGLLIAAYM
ncbi:MAG: stage II sporulation protein M [Candidatus Pacearchaeota archaeon]